MALLELTSLTRRVGGRTAIEGLSLAVEEGEVFALVGPATAGKTALLRLVAGLERPDGGTIVLDGVDITELPARFRPVTLMFQRAALFPHMSVAANVAYGLEMEGLRRREIRRRVAEILESLQLRQLARRRPHELSAAARQRVALARAAVKRPRMLLLDEPLGGLDRGARQEGQLELMRLYHELGCAVLMATREPEDALLLADRVGLLNEGRLLQQGTARQLYERPESRFAAAYLGAVNLLEGYAAEQGLRVAHLGLLKGEMAGPIAPGEPAVLAVRPERLLLSAGALGTDNAFAAQLEEVSYRGQDVLLHFAVEGLAARLLARATAAGFEALRLEEGQMLTLGFEARHGRILPVR